MSLRNDVLVLLHLPMPVSETVSAPPALLWTTLTDAFRAPFFVGVNRISIVQLAPGSSVVPQVVVRVA